MIVGIDVKMLLAIAWQMALGPFWPQPFMTHRSLPLALSLFIGYQAQKLDSRLPSKAQQPVPHSVDAKPPGA